MFYHPLTIRPLSPTYPAAHNRFSQPTIPLNIRETNTSYELHLLAPGRQKSDFKIAVAADKTLLITYDTPTPSETGHWLHQEFKLTSFSRSVKLNDRADLSGITAIYDSGLLTISIPKRTEEAPVQKEIPVA